MAEPPRTFGRAYSFTPFEGLLFSYVSVPCSEPSSLLGLARQQDGTPFLVRQYLGATLDARLMSVAAQVKPSFQINAGQGWPSYSVTPDGGRFLMWPTPSTSIDAILTSSPTHELSNFRIDLTSFISSQTSRFEAGFRSK